MKLCVALDLASRDENLAIARALKGLDVWLKVGLRSYLRDGANFLNELKKIDDFKIFVDLKIYDIPNTMADAAEVISNIGADICMKNPWYLQFPLLQVLAMTNFMKFTIKT